MPLAILALLKHGSPKDMVNMKRVARDVFVELAATSMFVTNGLLSALSTGKKLVAQDAGDEHVARVLPIAMSFGISIMTLAYSIGHLTGGHMNPGVSLMMFLRRQLSFPKMLCYWLAQFIGATLGAAMAWGCTSFLSESNDEHGDPPFSLGSTTLDPSVSTGNGFLLEFVGSFFFFFVISQTALDKRGIGESMFPAIPIGFALVVTHICLIPFTGCGVNPARTFGPSVVVCMSQDGDCSAVMGEWYWIYWVGPFLASWAVAEFTTLLELEVEDSEDTSETEQIIKESPPLIEDLNKTQDEAEEQVQVIGC